MKNWKVDYAYRKDGKYHDDSMIVVAMSAEGAIREATSVLNGRAWNEAWTAKMTPDSYRSYMIWNVGIIADADEEVF